MKKELDSATDKAKESEKKAEDNREHVAGYDPIKKDDPIR